MDKLKPCPFCGSKALRHRGESWVACSSTTCDMLNGWIFIDEWNTRPIEDQLLAELAAERRNLVEVCELAHIALCDSSECGYIHVDNGDSAYELLTQTLDHIGRLKGER